MNLFQWMVLPVLAVILAVDCCRLFRGTERRARLLRLAICALALLAILRPDWTSSTAIAIGIGRGADLVLYVFILLFLVVAFYFYARCVWLQRQITELVRRDAILHAKFGASHPSISNIDNRID
jgi:hypothetical protein